MATSAVRQKTVLYVESDPKAITQVTNELAPAGGTVRPAADLRAAQSILRECDPDYVVTAHDLPDSDAFDVIDAVHATDCDPPVVVFTDADDPRLSEVILDAGAYFVPNHGNGPGRLRRRLEAFEQEAPDPDLSESVKEQALEEAPIGLTIAEVTDTDELLVYANDSFERLTGYPPEAVLGRNCRFLQNGRTRPEATAKLRAAIEAGESASVELRNQRRDGTLFWNRVEIAPIHDESGEITHYVGFQTDVTRRRQAESAAQRWARECRDERQAVEQVLDQITGLIAETTRGLVQSGSRRELERRVCDCFAATDRYAGAWFGEVDPPREVVEPRAHAGDIPSDSVFEHLSVSENGAVADALTAGGVRVASSPMALTSTDDTPSDEKPVAIVPVTYRGTEYGVILVYAATEDGFDDTDTVVLGAIGRDVGSAINALQSKRMATADSVVDVQMAVSGQSPLVELSDATDSRLIHEGVNRREDGTFLLFLRTESSASPAAMDRVLDETTAVSGTVVRDDPDGSLLEVSLPADSSFARLNELGVRLTDLEVDADQTLLALEAPGEPLARSAGEILDQQYQSVELRSLSRRARPGQTEQAFIRTVEESLTDRQLTALETAYQAGFFDWPHEASGDELADAMDVSRSTFHQHLHAAQRKIFGAILDN